MVVVTDSFFFFLRFIISIFLPREHYLLFKKIIKPFISPHCMSAERSI